MTDYINPDKFYPDDPARRIDRPPGDDSITTVNMDDRTASYTIPQMASNIVVINITGGCEYCMAEKRIMEHHGIFFNAYCVIFDGKLDVSYDNNDKDEWVCGHKAIKINYCPMCGRRMRET